MKANWEAAFAHVIQSEGGYVNDPRMEEVRGSIPLIST